MCFPGNRPHRSDGDMLWGGGGAEGPPAFACLCRSRSAAALLRRAQRVSSCVAIRPNPNSSTGHAGEVWEMCVSVACPVILWSRAIFRFLTQMILKEVGVAFSKECRLV